MSEQEKIKKAKDALVKSIRFLTKTLEEEWQDAEKNQHFKFDEFVTFVLERLLKEKKISFAASTQKTIEKTLRNLAKKNHQFPAEQLLKDFIWEVKALTRASTEAKKGEIKINFDQEVNKIIRSLEKKCTLNKKGKKLTLSFLGVDEVPFDFIQLIFQTAMVCVINIVKKRKLADMNNFDDVCMKYYSDFLYDNFLGKDQSCEQEGDEEPKYNLKVESLLRKYKQMTDAEFEKVISQSVTFFFNGEYKKEKPLQESTKRMLMNCLSPTSLISIDGKKCKKKKFQITKEAFAGLSNIVTDYIETNLEAGWDKKYKDDIAQDCCAYCNSLNRVSQTEKACLIDIVKYKIFYDFWRTKIDRRITTRNPSPNWSERIPIYRRSVCVAPKSRAADFFSEKEVCLYMDKARKAFELTNPDAIYFKGEASLNHHNIYQAIHRAMAVFTNHIEKDQSGAVQGMKGWIHLIDIQTALFDRFLPEKMTNRDQSKKPLPERNETGIQLSPEDFARNIENRDQIRDFFKKLEVQEAAVCLIAMYHEKISNKGESGFPFKEIADFLNNTTFRQENRAILAILAKQLKEFDIPEDTIETGLTELYSKKHSASTINTIWQRIIKKLNPDHTK